MPSSLAPWLNKYGIKFFPYFSWGSTMWGVLHSNLMLYEANDVLEAMMVHNRRLILVSPFQQPQKQVRSAQVWKIVTTITLWALWKCRCNGLYDAADQRLLDVLLEIWENLLVVVRGQYDNMRGSPNSKNYEQEKKEAFALMEKVTPVYRVN